MMAVACVCVCGIVSIACIWQYVSRVAHVNDSVEDRS